MPAAQNQLTAERVLSTGEGGRGSRGGIGDAAPLSLAEKIIKRQRRLEAARGAQDLLWDDIDRYVISRRAKYDIGNRSGAAPKEPASNEIYDNTAGLALQRFGDGFQSQTANPLIDWWMGRFRGPLKKDTQALKWIDEVKEALNFELARSSYYEDYNEAIMDAVSHGIATEAGPEWLDKEAKLGYRVFHPREIFCAFDTMGNPTLWHHKFLLTGRQIKKEFPDANITEQVQKRIKSNEFTEWVVIHAIEENTETAGQSDAKQDKKWRSTWVMEEGKILLEVGGYDTNPMDTWTWRPGGHGLYATCPAIDAIYDVIMTNSAAKSLLKATQLSVEPPLIMTEGVKGNVNFFPKGQTILHGPNDKVQAFQFPTNFSIGVEQINQMHEEINEKFRANLFSLLSGMQKDMPVVMAMGIQGEKVSLLIPIITRSTSKMLIPKINKTFQVLARNRRLPPPPPSIMRYINSPVDIEMIGPLATAAKRFLNQQSFQAMLMQLGEISKIVPPQFYQTLVEGFNPDEIRKYLVESNSAPQKLVLDDEILTMIRKNRMQMQQEAQRAEMMKSLADAYGKSNQAPEQGSPAQQVMDQGGKRKLTVRRDANGRIAGVEG